jgi:hypothetical protein
MEDISDILRCRVGELFGGVGLSGSGAYSALTARVWLMKCGVLRQ